jgi:transmembrane sensor
MNAREPMIPPRGAAEWFLAVHAAENPSTETVQAWLRWLDTCEENRIAFEEVSQVWQNTPAAVIARGMRHSSGGEYDGSMPVAEWRTRGRGRSFKNHAPRYVLAAAATVLLAVALYWQSGLRAVSEGEFVTGVGEHRQLQLEDGSRVMLGARSRLAVEYSDTGRRIRLDAGEAYFTVHKDPRRPFTVEAFEGAITALGTSFNVRATEDRVTVTVTDGSVRVADKHPVQQPGTGAAQVLGRGQQLSYRTDKAQSSFEPSRVAAIDVRESARWREGWLVYRDEPLKYVMADIARYTDLRISVDSAAGALQFSGAVSKNRIGEWIAALPEVAPVTVKREGGTFSIAAGVQ